MAPPSTRYIDTASVLLVLAVFSLVWRVRTAFFIPVPEPFEILILFFGCVLLLGALRSSLPRVREFASEIKRYRFVLAVVLATPLLGLLGSSLAGLGWLEYAREAAKEYIRLLVAIFFFTAAAYIAFARPRIVKPVFAAIVVSPLLLWLALIPSWQPFFVSGGRLQGAGNNSSYLALWITIGLVASVAFFLWERGKGRWGWFMVGLIIAPLILWTISRAAWLTAGIVLLAVGVLFLAQRFSRGRVRSLVTVFFGLVVALALGFALFPPFSRVIIAMRAVGPFCEECLADTVRFVAREAEITFTEGGKIKSVRVPAQERPVNVMGIYSDDRTEIWGEGASRLLRSPLGFGPVYYFWHPVGVVESMGQKHKLDVHNLWLGVGLSSGWLGLWALLFLVVRIGRGTMLLARRWEARFLALAASFFALLLFGFFADISINYLFWLIMGLIAAYSILDSRGELPPAAYEKQKEA